MSSYAVNYTSFDSSSSYVELRFGDASTRRLVSRLVQDPNVYPIIFQGYNNSTGTNINVTVANTSLVSNTPYEWDSGGYYYTTFAVNSSVFPGNTASGSIDYHMEYANTYTPLIANGAVMNVLFTTTGTANATPQQLQYAYLANTTSGNTGGEWISLANSFHSVAVGSQDAILFYQVANTNCRIPITVGVSQQPGLLGRATSNSLQTGTPTITWGPESGRRHDWYTYSNTTGSISYYVSYISFTNPSDTTYCVWAGNTFSGRVHGGSSEQQSNSYTSSYTNFHNYGLKTDTAPHGSQMFAMFRSSSNTGYVLGMNQYGQFGNGSILASGSNNTPSLIPGVIPTGISSPVQVNTYKTTNSWKSVAAGRGATIAIYYDDTMWMWGGYGGYLVPGSSLGSANTMSPTQITGSWTSITLNARHDKPIGIRTDGTMWTWGGQYSGGNRGAAGAANPQLTYTNLTQIVGRGYGGPVSWKSVSSSGWNTFAIGADDTMWGFGWTGNMPVDTRQMNAQSWSMLKLTGSSPAVAIAIGPANTGLYTWGHDATNWGLLGDKIAGGLQTIPGMIDPGSWIYATTSRYQSAAIKADNTLWLWGYNQYGVLGDGTTISRSSPVQVAGSWTYITTSNAHAFGVKTDGTLWVWGGSSFAIRDAMGLNSNTTAPLSSPVQIGTANNWARVYVSGEYAGENVRVYAITTSNTLWGWGYNEIYGGLGTGGTTRVSSPVQIGTDTNWLKILRTDQSARYGASFGMKTDGTLWTWGMTNSTIQYVSSSLPTTPVGTWKYATTGGTNTTTGIVLGLIDSTDRLWMAGYNSNYNLGVTSPSGRPWLEQIPGSWKMVSLTQQGAVGVKTDGTLWEWGYTIARTTTSSPVQIGTDTDWSSAVRSQDHALAIKTNGAGYAWGNNTYGYLGIGNTSARIAAPTIIAGALSWVTLSAGNTHSIGITSTGKLYNWGYNSVYGGALAGNAPIYTVYNSPVQVGTETTWTSCVAAFMGSLAIREGKLFAWGYSGSTIRADNSTVGVSSPVQVGTDTTWTKVTRAFDAGGGNAYYALKANTVYGWGYSSLWDTAYRSSPVQVGTITTFRDINGSVFLSGANNVYMVNGSGVIAGMPSTGGNTFIVGGQVVPYLSTPVQLSATQYTNIELVSDTSYDRVWALKPDGTLWAWGQRGNVGFGDNIVNTTASSPVQIGVGKSFTQIWSINGSMLGLDTTGAYWFNGYEAALAPIGSFSGQYDWWNQSSVGGYARSSPIQLGTIGAQVAYMPMKIGTSSWKQVSTHTKFPTAPLSSYTDLSPAVVSAIDANNRLWVWGTAANSNIIASANLFPSAATSSPVQVGTDTTWLYTQAGITMAAIKG